MKSVLIVEDDPITMKILCATIEKHGFSTIRVTSGNEALSLLKKHEIHAVILDLNLPDMSGLEILKHIRNHPVLNSIAAIIVTENDDKLEAVLGLEMGADDYVTKPFHQRELVARLNTVLRRTQRVASGLNSSLLFGDLYIDIKKRLVKKNDTVIDLSFKEFETLLLLASNAGEVLSRETIMDTLGGMDYNPETRTIDMHIASIRKKLGDTSSEKKYIDTVSGVGYRFRK
ncbi:MAG: response regulator transcription factor [Pseudomonadota bacterium]